MYKQLFTFCICLLSIIGYSQEYAIATPETIDKYEKTKIGQEVHIYMQIVKYDGNDMGTIPEKKDWKYNPKKDLLIIGTVTEKLRLKGPNLFFKIRLNKMFKGKKSISKMNILLEEMSINGEVLLNMQDLKFE